MEKLPPIPTPITTQWREFRYRFVPIITFGVLVAAIAVMWRDYVAPPNVLAEAEPIAVRIISTAPGTLIQLNVERYQKVNKGQQLCVVEVMDTNTLQAELLGIEADMRLMKARMGLDQTRNEQNYLQEKLTLESEKAQLEVNRVEMKKALAAFLIVSNLFNKSVPLETEANYDLARYAYLSLSTNVAVTAIRLAEKEKSLPKLLGTMDPAVMKALDDDVTHRVQNLLASQKKVFRSPIDGTVSAVSNWVGEGVLAGRPIMIITASESTNILAFARAPLSVTPKIGDPVLVTKLAQRRQVGYAKVVQVGSQMELIDRPLLGASGGRYGYEIGLPFLVTVPKNLELAPGERVDLVLNPPQPKAEGK